MKIRDGRNLNQSMGGSVVVVVVFAVMVVFSVVVVFSFQIIPKQYRVDTINRHQLHEQRCCRRDKTGPMDRRRAYTESRTRPILRTGLFRNSAIFSDKSLVVYYTTLSLSRYAYVFLPSYKPRSSLVITPWILKTR